MSWAKVGNAGNVAGNVTSCTVTYSATAGNLLCLGWNAYQANGGTTWSVSDGHNTWTNVVGTTPIGNMWCGLFYALVSTGGSLSIVLTGTNSGSYLGVGVVEFSHLGTVGVPTDSDATGSGGTQNSGNATFSGSYNFLGFGVNTVLNANASVSGAWTPGNAEAYNSATNEGYVDGYQLNLSSSASPIAFTGTGGTGAWGSCVMVFSEIPASDYSPPPILRFFMTPIGTP